MEVTLIHMLMVSALVFVLGVTGIFLNRRNIIVILMSIELILLAVNIAFITFSRFLHGVEGEVFTLFILAVAAAEAAIGLAILVIFFRKHRSISVDQMRELKE